MLHRHPITLESFGIENLRKEREKRLVRAGLHNVLAVRLREGYTLKSIYISQGEKQAQLDLILTHCCLSCGCQQKLLNENKKTNMRSFKNLELKCLCTYFTNFL